MLVLGWSPAEADEADSAVDARSAEGFNNAGTRESGERLLFAVHATWDDARLRLAAGERRKANLTGHFVTETDRGRLAFWPSASTAHVQELRGKGRGRPNRSIRPLARGCIPFRASSASQTSEFCTVRDLGERGECDAEETGQVP